MTLASIPVSRIMRTEFASLRETDRLDLADQIMKLGRYGIAMLVEGRIAHRVESRPAEHRGNVSISARNARFLRPVDVAMMTRGRP
jgi:hypothetical protein